MLRTQENYSTHCSEKTYGIEEQCVFHQIKNYHVTQNLVVDPMHDIFEGICRYDIAKILNDLIYEEKLFTLNVLKDRIRCFNHSIDSNIPPPLNEKSIKNNVIVLSASEMHYLINYLTLFIGDLIGTTNNYWKLYLLLRKIVCITVADAINEGIIKNFEILVTKYLTFHKKLLKSNFKTKHHNLLHYPRIMRAFRPLKNISSMRFEAKHKQIKEISKVVTSRMNPSYTLAMKHQLQFANTLIRNIGFSKINISHSRPVKTVRLLKEFLNFKEYIPFNFFDFYSYSWVRINGTHYEIDNIFNYNENDFQLFFGKIKHIIMSHEKEVIFVYCKVEILSQSCHLSL